MPIEASLIDSMLKLIENDKYHSAVAVVEFPGRAEYWRRRRNAAIVVMKTLEDLKALVDEESK